MELNQRLVRALLLPLTILAWLAVAVVVFWLLGHVTRAILMLVLSAVVASALTLLVGLLERFLPRALAVGLAYVVGFTVLISLLAILVVTAASQVSNLVHNLPAYAEDAKTLQPRLLAVLSPLGVTADQLDQSRRSAVALLQSAGTRAAGDALGLVSRVLNTVIDAILVLILSVYLTANAPRIRAALRAEAPREHLGRVNLLIGIVNQVVGGYVRGTVTLATLIGVLVGAGMGVLQVRYALLLGVLAFFMEFIPIIGVFISGAVCVLIALFQGWLLALIVLGYFVVVHVIEGDLVGPRIMGKAVGIHPAVALVALVAGTELFGLWGALFGAPVAGLIQAVAVAVWRELRDAGAHQVAAGLADRQAAKVKRPPRPRPAA